MFTYLVARRPAVTAGLFAFNAGVGNEFDSHIKHKKIKATSNSNFSLNAGVGNGNRRAASGN